MANNRDRSALKLILYAAIVVSATALIGCQALLQSSLSAGGGAHADPNAASYYYFSAAQIKLKQGDVNEAIWHMRQALKHDPHSVFLRLELANLHLIKKEDALALEQIAIILDHRPNYVPALMVAGRIHQQRKEIKEAKAVLEKVLAHKPDEQQIYLLLGRIYWEENDLKNAARVFKQMVANFPDDYASHYFYGKALVAMGMLESAEQEMVQSLTLEPSLKEPREELLKIYKHQNKSGPIATLYNELLLIEPDNPMHVLGLAEHYRSHGEENRAKQLLMDLGRQSQSNKEIIPAVFESYVEPKKYDTALWVFTAMLAAVPEDSDLNYLAGMAANGLKRDLLALEHMAKVAPQSRFYQNAVVQSAIIYHDMGNIDLAIEVVRRAIAHAPDNTDYYVYLASFYEELERYDDALNSLRQGLAVDDQNPRIHFRIGMIYDRMGRKEASIEALRRVVQLAPDDAEALNYLGYTYADMGINLDEAMSLIRTALSLKPDDGYITDSLGWVYYKQGQYSEALHWLKKAVSLVPDDPTILEHLGDVYLKMGRKQKALIHYQRSLDKKEKDREVLEQKIEALAPHQ